ncbi:MAG: carboxypeptidase regulatory-like domain-containing protein [Methylococcaceae bacterium]|nr:carboxypeptidase regulatory-like domain-containing protein [Methylococcaceae bacterium]
MKNWSSWEIIRSQVAICGQVVDEHNQPLGNIEVKLTSMPEKFSARVAMVALNARYSPSLVKHGLDFAVTKSNGSFFFPDLPDGDYSVSAMTAKIGLQDRHKVSVLSNNKGDIKRIAITLKI